MLWKNRRIVANRMRYAGGASEIRAADLGLEGEAAEALSAPEEPDELEAVRGDLRTLLQDVPGRVLRLGARPRLPRPNEDKNNTGRLLGAGFHSMTGYFRDDGPLYELMLDDDGRRELDRLWREFDFITGAPIRQYSSYLWYERAETGFMRGDEAFDFVRAEDKDASSKAKMGRLADVYLAKARRLRASDEAIKAIEDQFKIFAETIHRVERDRRDAEPRHIEALQAFAERAYRRPLTTTSARAWPRFTASSARKTAWTMRTRSATRSSAC